MPVIQTAIPRPRVKRSATCRLCGTEWDRKTSPQCSHTEAEWAAWGQQHNMAPGFGHWNLVLNEGDTPPEPPPSS